MTTTDLIYEFARERLPGIVRDIMRREIRKHIKKEMRDLLSPVNETHSTWDCSWCGYRNIRFNAGHDHCSVCGAETFTYFVGANDLRVKFTRNPKPHHKSKRFVGRLCQTPYTGHSTTTYTPPDGST